MKFFPKFSPRAKRTAEPTMMPESFANRIADLTAPGGYRLVLEGAAYEAQRLRVWNRDGGRCRCCGHEVNLHASKKNAWEGGAKACEIHHIRRRGMGGADRNDRLFNLILFCWKCHEAVEAGRILMESIRGVYTMIWRGVEWVAATKADAMEVADGC